MRDLIFNKVDTPESLDNFVRGVARGNYRSLIIIGRGGTGKSTIVRKHFPPNREDDDIIKHRGAYWKTGRVSPVKFYEHLWRYRDCNIVLDDAPSLERNLPLAGLMRQLCETEDIRRISWDTQNIRFQQDQVPPSFPTKSKFIVICNKWMGRHEEVEALETRVPIVVYEPAVELIHAQAIEAMKVGRRNIDGHMIFEPPVIRYVNRAIHDKRVHTLNLRDYIIASDMYRNGDDWQTNIEKRILPDTIDEIPDDADFILGYMVRMDMTRVSEAEVYRRTKRFRGVDGKDRMVNAFAWLADRGKLLKIPQKGQRGRGRPMSQEYTFPPYKVIATKSKKQAAI